MADRAVQRFLWVDATILLAVLLLVAFMAGEAH